MITKEAFYRQLADLDTIIIPTEGLKKLADQFPYAAILRVVLAHRLKAEDDLGYESQLQMAATLSASREQLYKILYQRKVRSILQEHEPENFTDPKPTVDASQEKPVDIPVSPLEQEILNHALSASYELATVEDPEQSLSELSASIGGKNPNKPVENVPKKEPKPTQSKRSRMDWLDLLDEREGGIKPTELDQPIAASKKEETGKLPTSQFFTPQDMAKLSLLDKEDFVTETLAKIYLEQQLFDKAIKAYESLLLKFPEKSSYFEALLQQAKALKAEN